MRLLYAMSILCLSPVLCAPCISGKGNSTVHIHDHETYFETKLICLYINIKTFLLIY